LESTINRSMSKFQHRLDEYEQNLAEMWNQRANISIHRVGSSSNNSPQSNSLIFQHVLTEIKREVQNASKEQLKHIEDSRTKLKAALNHTASSTQQRDERLSRSIKQGFTSVQDAHAKALARTDSIAEERHDAVMTSLKDAGAAIAQFTGGQSGALVATAENLHSLRMETIPELERTMGGKFDAIAETVSDIDARLEKNLDAGIVSMEHKISEKLQDLQAQLADGLTSQREDQTKATKNVASQLDERIDSICDLISTSERNVLRKLNFTESARVVRREVSNFNSAIVDVLSSQLNALQDPRVLETRFVGLEPAHIRASAAADVNGGFRKLDRNTKIDFSTAVSLVRFQGVGVLPPDAHDVTGMAQQEESASPAPDQEEQSLSKVIANTLGLPPNNVALARRSKSESQLQITAGVRPTAIRLLVSILECMFRIGDCRVYIAA